MNLFDCCVPFTKLFSVQDMNVFHGYVSLKISASNRPWSAFVLWNTPFGKRKCSTIDHNDVRSKKCKLLKDGQSVAFCVDGIYDDAPVLQNVCPFDFRPLDDVSGLSDSVKRGNYGEVENLLWNDADPNTVREDGKGVLLTAVERDYTTISDILLKAGADPNIKDKSGRSVLLIAVQNNSVNIVSCLLRAGANPNITNSNGYSVLLLAVRNQNSSIVSSLLNAGANPNVNETDGCSALLMAVKEKNLAIVSLLLEAGADPSIKDAQGNSPLTEVFENDMQCFITLISRSHHSRYCIVDDLTVLMHAVLKGDMEEVKELLVNGENPNAQERKEGKTALLLAVAYDHTEIAEYLIKVKANPLIENVNGQTALSVASDYGRVYAKSLSREAKSFSRIYFKPHQDVSDEASEDLSRKRSDNVLNEGDGCAFMCRDNGQFGSFSLHDQYGDEADAYAAPDNEWYER